VTLLSVDVILQIINQKICDEFSQNIDRARFSVPPNTLYVILGTGFYGSNDPTNSVQALKEAGSKGLDFNPIRSTPPRSQ